MRRYAILLAGCLVLAAAGPPARAASLQDIVKKHQQDGAEMIDWIEARVNDDVITHREYDDRLRIAALMLSREPDTELRQAVLRQMVEDLLILQLARKDNVMVSEEQLKILVDKEIAASIARAPSEEEFWKYWERNRVSPDAYRQYLADLLRRGAMIKRMQYRMVDQLVVTASDVEKFKQEHPTAASARDKIDVGLIQLSLPRDATPEAVEGVMLKARTLKARLDAGDDFERMAREYSTHPSRDSGGNLGEVAPGDAEQLDFLFEKQPGFTSDPVREDNAVRIYRILARRSLSDLVLDFKFQQEMKKTLDELKAAAIIEIRGQRVEFF